MFQNKLSRWISRQLPEYVVETYPRFVEFLTAYYEFLEQDSGASALLLNAETWTNIDLTLDLFVARQRAQLAWDIPQTTIVAQRRLLKYINQYYEAKGSEDAAELFFRFMYDDTVSVTYPGDYVLRGSDGVWTRSKNIKLDNTAFPENSPFDLNGEKVTLTYLEFIPNVGSVRKEVEISCMSVIGCGFPNIFRLDVDLDPNYPFPAIVLEDTSIAASLGDYDSHIYLKRNGLYYGSLSAQLVGIDTIEDGGQGYRTGDVALITDVSSQNEIVIHAHRVTDGALRTIQLISSGQRFPVRVNIGIGHYFAEDYMVDNDDYASDPAITEPVNTFETTLVGSTPATILFDVGFVFVNAGRFLDSRGFLSDINRLQDNYKYQPYSYEIEGSLARSVWEQTYTKSAHPAGMKLFANVLIQDDITLTPVFIENNIKETEFLFDTVSVIDSLSADIGAPVSENFSLAGATETIDIVISLEVDDTVSIGETVNGVLS